MKSINKDKEALITPEVLKNFRYEPDTGELWRYCSYNGRGIPYWHLCKLSDKARTGIRFLINNHSFIILIHRLIWRIQTGTFPPDNYVIDHIDQNFKNNRFVNLRLANQAQNMKNVFIHKSNKLGIKGVCWLERLKKYKAATSFNRKSQYIGLYETAKEASIMVDIVNLLVDNNTHYRVFNSIGNIRKNNPHNDTFIKVTA